LFTLTANYRYGFDRIHDSRYGMYVIGGGRLVLPLCLSR